MGPSIPFMLAPLVVAHLTGLALLAAVISGASTRLSVKVLLVLSVVIGTSAVGLAVALALSDGQLVVPHPRQLAS